MTNEVSSLNGALAAAGHGILHNSKLHAQLALSFTHSIKEVLVPIKFLPGI